MIKPCNPGRERCNDQCKQETYTNVYPKQGADLLVANFGTLDCCARQPKVSEGTDQPRERRDHGYKAKIRRNQEAREDCSRPYLNYEFSRLIGKGDRAAPNRSPLKIGM